MTNTTRRPLINRLGKEVPEALEAEIVARANREMAAMEEKGFGMMLNGRYKAGAPVRTTAGSVLGAFGWRPDFQGRSVSQADCEAAMERHFDRKREGNKVFFTKKAV